jgi:hypothetical protein
MMGEPLAEHRTFSACGEAILPHGERARSNGPPDDLQGGVRFARGLMVGLLISLPIWAALLWVVL